MNARLTDLSTALTTFDISLAPETIATCEAFAELLVMANEERNLTRLSSKEGLTIGMFLDSLLFLHSLPPGKRIIDVGCGAGFPSIPLAIALPERNFVALDSRKMKCDFIEAACQDLGLTNVEVRHGRAEDVERNQFDIALARALGSLSRSLSLTLPLVTGSGTVVIARSARELKESCAACRKLIGARQLQTWSYRLPGYRTDFAHVVVKGKGTEQIL